MVAARTVAALAAVLALAAPSGAQQLELLDFYLPTCGPCRAMAPTIARLEAEGVRVRRVDGSREPQLAARFGVTTYPTFIAVQGGQERGRIVGFTDYADLERLTAAAPVRPVGATFAPGSAEPAIATPPGEAALEMMKAMTAYMNPDYLTYDSNALQAEFEAGNVALANFWGSRAGGVTDAEGSTPEIAKWQVCMIVLIRPAMPQSRATELASIA